MYLHHYIDKRLHNLQAILYYLSLSNKLFLWVSSGNTHIDLDLSLRNYTDMSQ